MYEEKMSIRETDRAIKLVKDRFEEELSRQLNLERVTAPLFVRGESGLNDNLNGTERPVEFDIPFAGEEHVQIVHSLAKWKRMALAKYGFAPGEGLYTDMNAIRRDEQPDCLHSVYVDQWDWEKVITAEDRTISYLEKVAAGVFNALNHTKNYINGLYNLKGEIKRDFTTVSSRGTVAGLSQYERKRTGKRHLQRVWLGFADPDRRKTLQRTTARRPGTGL